MASAMLFVFLHVQKGMRRLDDVLHLGAERRSKTRRWASSGECPLKTSGLIASAVEGIDIDFCEYT